MSELPNPPGGHTVYGITVYPLGDEGTEIAAFGHHDKRRFLAACNHYARTICGLANLTDNRRDTAAGVLADIEHQTVLFDPAGDEGFAWWLRWDEEFASSEATPVPVTYWNG